LAVLGWDRGDDRYRWARPGSRRPVPGRHRLAPARLEPALPRRAHRRGPVQQQRAVLHRPASRQPPARPALHGHVTRRAVPAHGRCREDPLGGGRRPDGGPAQQASHITAGGPVAPPGAHAVESGELDERSQHPRSDAARPTPRSEPRPGHPLAEQPSGETSAAASWRTSSTAAVPARTPRSRLDRLLGGAVALSDLGRRLSHVAVG